jgi:hypothetical protein
MGHCLSHSFGRLKVWSASGEGLVANGTIKVGALTEETMK